MSRFILILFIACSFTGFSQLTDKVEAKNFWTDNIRNIVEYNKEDVLAQIHFPLKVGDKKLTKDQFRVVMDKHFNPELRRELSTKDIESIDAWKMGDDLTQTYMIVCRKGLDAQYEAAVLCFLQYNGKWMLNQIDYHKKENEED
ncbi:hypothetical protein [Fluviicola taffensis]|uniref:hypothetical protein n=1 Tax=Fluviicola taffensis TaxID=191579 RepID=UPI003137C236